MHEDLSSDIESILEILSKDENAESDVHEPTTDSDIEVVRHKMQYVESYISYANKKIKIENITVSDTVLLKRDFDNNTKSRKYPLDLSYSDIEYRVIEIRSNLYHLQDSEGDVIKVARNRIKKLTKMN